MSVQYHGPPGGAPHHEGWLSHTSPHPSKSHGLGSKVGDHLPSILERHHCTHVLTKLCQETVVVLIWVKRGCSIIVNV